MKHKALFKIETQEIPRFLFASNEKKPVKRVRDGAYCPITVGQALNAYSYCPINDEIRTDDNQSDLGIFCSYD